MFSTPTKEARKGDNVCEKVRLVRREYYSEGDTASSPGLREFSGEIKGRVKKSERIGTRSRNRSGESGDKGQAIRGV